MSFRNTKTPNKPKEKGKWQIPMRPGRGGKMEYYLTDELEEKFRKAYPIHSNRRIMQWFGISFTSMQRFRRKLGLAKNMTAIRKELARDVKRICENNGYYASLRGKPVSEACKEGAKMLAASGFSSIKAMKEKNPRRYKRIIRKKAASWKETREKDMLKVKYGLEQKTKFRIVLSPMKHGASSQKHAMIAHNNYFSDPEHPDWVCYDNKTRRSARREATAVKKGLRIVEGEQCDGLDD